MKTLAIVNSLCLKKLKKQGLIIRHIIESIGADIRYTEYKGHASEIASSANDFDAILSVGGDGTLFEIINGAGPARYKFGIIPVGTANSLAHDLGICSLDKAFGVIRRGLCKDIDLIDARLNQGGRVKHLYVSFAAGGGFFSRATRNADLYFKNLGGICYPSAGFFSSFGNKKIYCELSPDEKSFVRSDFTSLFVANAAHIGYMRILKEASITDGRFNVWIGTLGTINQLIWDLNVITGGRFRYPGTIYKLKRMEIKFPQPRDMMLDGELFYSIASAQFLVSDKKLTIFC